MIANSIPISQEMRMTCVGNTLKIPSGLYIHTDFEQAVSYLKLKIRSKTHAAHDTSSASVRVDLVGARR